MKNFLLSGLLIPALSSGVALAQVPGGTQYLLCAAQRVIECDAGDECQSLPAQAVNAPEFLKIDLAHNTITSLKAAEVNRSTSIERVEQVDGKLILQGAEDGIEGVRDGLGWTLAISEPGLRMVLSASGDEVAFVIFGACTPL